MRSRFLSSTSNGSSVQRAAVPAGPSPSPSIISGPPLGFVNSEATPHRQAHCGEISPFAHKRQSLFGGMTEAAIVRYALALLAASALAGMARVSSASATSHANGWYWPPSLCKSQLLNHGVSLDDGRYVRALAVKCFGRYPCVIDHRDRIIRYDHFSVIMLDRNGIVRTLDLTATGRFTSTFAKMRVWPGLKWDETLYAVGSGGISPSDPTYCKKS